MKKFEMSFQSNWQPYVRLYNTDTNKSEIIRLPKSFEYYVPEERGDFSSFYKPNIKYRKEKGDFKTAKSNISMFSPTETVIRDVYNFSGSYNDKPEIFYLDIETRTGTKSKGFPNPNLSLEPVCLIQIKVNSTKEIFILGDKEFYFDTYYRNLEDVKEESITYIHCQNETEIFNQYFKLILTYKPLITFAWNGEGFDFPYLFNRCKRLSLSVNNFSPFNDTLIGDLSRLREYEINGRIYASLETAGGIFIDMIQLYRKFVLQPRESYSLDSISEVELKVNKVKHEEFPTFDDFYLGNWKKPQNPTEEQMATLCYKLNERKAPYDIIQKAGYGQFVYYGIKDVVLLHNLDKKLGLTKLMIEVAEKQGSQLVDIMGTTKPWAQAIRNLLYRSNMIVNPLDIEVDIEKSIEGGYVREPIKGKQEWVISADVNSMYPLLSIAGSNMSPETFVFARDLEDLELKEFVYKELKVGTDLEQKEDNMLRIIKDPEKSQKLKELLKRNNLSMAPNGTFYRKDVEGFIPKMVKDIYVSRKKAKKEMIALRQQIKSLLDS